MNYETLNEKQKMVFNQIESHYNSILKGHQVESLRIIIIGIAGTGKTYLINSIWSRLYQMAGFGSKPPVFVLVLTDVIAFNINGITIYSTLSIPIITNKNLDIKGECLKQL